MPTELNPRYQLEKHLLRSYVPMKAWFDRMILEFKNQRSTKRARGLHELERQDEENGENDKEVPADNALYSLLLYAKDVEVAKILGPEELLTFQRWKAGTGGGKG